MFIRQMSGGSCQQVPGRNLTMHEHRQSYRAVVPAKSLNKTGQPTVAEGMEGRALVKGTSSSETRSGLSTGVSCPMSCNACGR